MLKTALVSGAPPQTPLGYLTMLPKPLMGGGVLPTAIATFQDLSPLEIQSGYAPALYHQVTSEIFGNNLVDGILQDGDAVRGYGKPYGHDVR